MVHLAAQLPEYETVRAIYGVGDVITAQFTAEIGDVRNYPRRSSIVAFAGIDPEVNQSGKMDVQSNSSSKRGSPYLRKNLYRLMPIYLRLAPSDEPVYQFLDKKRFEGKPCVYMAAGANKLLRIFCARVKAYMSKLEESAEAKTDII